MPRAVLYDGRHQFSCYIDQDMKKGMQKIVDNGSYESMSHVARVAITELLQRHNIYVSANITPKQDLVKVK